MMVLCVTTQEAGPGICRGRDVLFWVWNPIKSFLCGRPLRLFPQT
jgi:hypothetical protein